MDPRRRASPSRDGFPCNVGRNLFPQWKTGADRRWPAGRALELVGGGRGPAASRIVRPARFDFAPQFFAEWIAAGFGRCFRNGESLEFVFGGAEQALKDAADGTARTPAIAALFSPRDDNLLFAVGTATVRLWRFDVATKSWKAGKTFTIPQKPMGSTAKSAAISPDGTWLVLGMSDGSSIVAGVDGVFRALLNGSNRHAAAVRSVAVSADGTWIVSGSDDKTAVVWERTADGKNWDAIARLTGHPAPVNAVGISRDRFRVLTGSEDKTAKVWDTRRLVQGTVEAAPDKRKIAFHQQAYENLQAVKRELSKNELANRLAMNPVRNRRLIGRFEELRMLTRPDSPPNVITKVDQQTKQMVDKLVDLMNPDQAANPVDPTANWNVNQLRATTLVLKRLLAGPDSSVTEVLTLRGHQRGVTAVSFSPDGNAVLTGSKDGRRRRLARHPRAGQETMITTSRFPEVPGKSHSTPCGNK